MADFVQTMKDWKRMCKAYTTYGESCCKGCPIMGLQYDEYGCGAIFSKWANVADWDEVEDVINVWAAEHPEPKYPTWWEWLENMGIVSKAKSESSKFFDTTRMYDNIPADIAQKLGIEPKEGT